MSRPDCDRLNRELAILYADLRRKSTADVVARQLISDAERPLPDVLPQPPRFTTFEWPAGGRVDYIAYWQAADRRAKVDWGGPYL